MNKTSNSKFMIFLTFIWYFFNGTTNATQAVQCYEGTYVYYFENDHFCSACPQGTFMPWKNYTGTSCFVCAKIEDPNVEIIIKPCDKSHDTDIQCVEGYYRQLGGIPNDKPLCQKCTSSCSEHYLQVNPCGNFTDTGCCPNETFGRARSRRCRNRPKTCSRGQYLDTLENDCKPCPENSFMPENYHFNTKCRDCQNISDTDLPLHVIITEPCTSTRPPQYGCQDGFYINHGTSYRGDDITCSRCQICDERKYVGRPCNMYHDTVCCDKPNMAVAYIPQGGQCIDEIGTPHLHPYVGILRVKQGNCQSVMCYVALNREKKKPDLVWDGPDFYKQQQFQYEEQNDETGMTVYHNTLTLCNFSAVDQGDYRCRDNLWTLRIETHLSIVLACKDGSYNPPACDKTCSQHCRPSERSDVSLCDNNNGTCLFGCVDGYTGDTCETVQDTSCPYGRYGRNCTKICSPHCLIPTDIFLSPCDLVNGFCVGGCIKGYFGDRCILQEPPAANSGAAVEQDYKKDTTTSSTHRRPYYHMTTDTTTVIRSSVPETTTVTRDSVPIPITVTRATVSQTSPHDYIILGIFILFTIGAVTFCVYKLRKIFWKYFCIPIKNKTTRNSSRRYVNVSIGLHSVPSAATEDEDHQYESVH